MNKEGPELEFAADYRIAVRAIALRTPHGEFCSRYTAARHVLSERHFSPTAAGYRIATRQPSHNWPAFRLVPEPRNLVALAAFLCGSPFLVAPHPWRSVIYGAGLTTRTTSLEALFGIRLVQVAISDRASSCPRPSCNLQRIAGG